MPSHFAKASDSPRWRVAERTGLEPAASGVTGRRYNQLNYRSKQSMGLDLLQAGVKPGLRRYLRPQVTALSQSATRRR
jgi:hypothetical protein